MSMLDEKRIETLTMKVKDIKTGFGNPRKIGKKEAEELEESLEKYGDFGLFLIDEHDNVIAGNQRLSILQRKDGDIEVLCKRLIGYTKSELRAINIKDNTHSGEWDLEELAKWTADLNIDLGVKLDNKDQMQKKIKEMELIRFEKYDYVLLVSDYFLNCPLLKDGVFRVDALGTEPVEYTIETGIFDPIIERYVDGSSERQFQFQFGSREFYSMDRLQNIDNSTFYEELAEWVEEQSLVGNLPELPEGMSATEIEVLSPGYIHDGAMKNARYQISLRLLYFKEA